MIYLGMDFGTTNSCIYVANDSDIPKPMLKERCMPSVLCEKIEGGKPIRYYGADALGEFDKDVKFFSNLKLSLRDKANRGKFNSKRGWQYYRNGRALSGQEYNKKELVKDFIKHLLNKAGIKFGEDSITYGDRESAALKNVKITMGYPVFHDLTQRDAYHDFFREILIEIGFKKDNILFETEPCLAAYGLARGCDNDITVGDRILIFDCGGGTTDVSILTMEEGGGYSVVECEGCQYAGVAIDKALFGYIKKISGQECSMDFINKVFNGKTDIDIKYLESIRKLKESASLNPNEIITKGDLEYSNELGLDFTDFRFADFYNSDFWDDVIKKILKPLNAVIQRASSTKRHKIKNFYLAGGSSAMPKIRDTLSKILNEHK